MVSKTFSTPEAQTLAKAVARAAKALGMTQEELGRTIGRDRTSIGRGLDPNGKAAELALLLIRAYRALHALCGGEAASIKHWFNTANRHTGGVPRQQVQLVAGLLLVMEYLESQHANL